MLKDNGILERRIYKWMEVVSYDNTLGEMESFNESNLPGNKIISIYSIASYTAIDKYEQSTKIDDV